MNTKKLLSRIKNYKNTQNKIMLFKLTNILTYSNADINIGLLITPFSNILEMGSFFTKVEILRILDPLEASTTTC